MTKATKKILAMFMVAVFIVTSMGIVCAQDLTMSDKLNILEKAYYGNEQEGALLDRVDRLEKDVYGAAGTASLEERLNKLYNYTFISTMDTPPSFVLRLNTVEWSVTHNVTTGPLKSRLIKLQQTVIGNDTKMSLDDMLRKITVAAFGTQSTNFAQATIPKDTLVRIEFLNDVGSKMSRVGDPVNFKVFDDVLVNNVVVIPRGAVGAGKVTKAEPAGSFGRTGVLEIGFESISTLDGTMVPVFVGEKAKQQTENMAYAAGASLVGLAILGPVGLVGGIFVQGDEMTLKTGQQAYLQTLNEVTVMGLVSPGQTPVAATTVSDSSASTWQSY